VSSSQGLCPPNQFRSHYTYEQLIFSAPPPRRSCFANCLHKKAKPPPSQKHFSSSPELHSSIKTWRGFVYDPLLCSPNSQSNIATVILTWRFFSVCSARPKYPLPKVISLALMGNQIPLLSLSEFATGTARWRSERPKASNADGTLFGWDMDCRDHL